MSEVTELKSERSSCHARLMIFKTENKIGTLSKTVVLFCLFFGLWFCALFLLSVWLLSFLSPQMDQLLGSVIEMWVDRMDNITQPERRKLSSLALLSLLPSDNRCDTCPYSSDMQMGLLVKLVYRLTWHLPSRP